jgi:Uma2 family endonuclease
MTAQLPALSEGLPIEVQLHPALALTDEQFFELCQINPDLRFERTAHGNLVIMPPTTSDTGNYNFDLNGQLWVWVKQDGTGKGFDSSTVFTLPNGAVRSPDAAWIPTSRWEAIPVERREKFAPICPNFVIELRSKTDSLKALQDKMQEYIDNGTLLGWLIDRQQQIVYVYRPSQAVEILNQPTTVSGDPVLPGFVLELGSLW